MHNEILTEEQKRLLPLIKRFSGEFGLVGGTAIALQIGHRRSIDYDLFALEDFDTDVIRQEIRKTNKIRSTFVERFGELTVDVDGIKMTFYKYPFGIEFSENLDDFIKIPSLLTLGAMKAFALGRRAKWKDYVDLFFIFKQHGLKEISDKARSLFGGEFNEKLLREELSYFSDIDYSQDIDYLEDFSLPDEEIEEGLKEISLS